MALLASFFFAARDWLPAAAIGFAVALILVTWTYLRTPIARGVRLVCAALKLLGMALLLACLLEPTWSEQRSKPGANIIAVVADNSLSMKLRGRGEKETRGEALQRILTREGDAWRQPLAENFGVRNYLVDARLQATRDFHELDFAGRSSPLGTALKTMAERYRGQPIAGVILLTDGVASDLPSGEIEGLPPIYPVIFGSESPPRDLAVSSTAVTQTSFEDAPVTIQADVTAIGCAGEQVVGQLFAIDPAQPAAEAKPVAEESLKVPPEGGKLVFRFQLRPEKSGVQFYRLRVAAANASETSEATLANNETIVTVDRGTGPQRILYVAGRPNWEYKFLQRAVSSDPETRLVALIRIAKREAKFEFRGREGESSNPLFRGFDNQSKEEIERYDRPVLVRLNTDDQTELPDGFPKTAPELFRYRAVILDDLEAEFFSAEQMTLLQRFVSERGGGLLMLGGAESFAEGKFARTPLGDLLPVYLDRAPSPASDAPFRMALTREGWLQPWARLRNNEADEKQRLATLPAFDVLNRVREIKPAAMVVAKASDGRAEYPAIVTQRFGRGRSAALLIGDLWQSGLGEESGQKDLGKAWRQIVRWMVADVPSEMELRAEPQADGEQVRLQLRARDPSFQPVENAAVSIAVHAVGAAEPVTLTAEASSDEPGLYEATYVLRESGAYRAEAAIKAENGALLGTAQAGWTADLAAAEFRSLSPNRALMETLARKTGGEVLSPDRLADFVRTLPAKRAPITELWTTPIWHTPAVFFTALACLVAEWGLRRWKGLA